MATTIVTKNGSGAPTDSDLVAGELAVDLTNGRLYTTDLDSGGTVLELGTNPASDVTFGDNTKAIFGAGDDLQIYHDGSNSYIEDAGAGVLFIKGTGGVYLRGKDSDEDLGRFLENGAVDLYYDGSTKLATTSTGIDVTGNVTADGLTVDDVVSIDTSTGNAFSSTGNLKIDIDSDNNQTDRTFQITSDGSSKTLFQAEEGGDISFYEDTGTTPKFFWDASAESLGIGTTSPRKKLEVSGIAGANVLQSQDTADSTNFLRMYADVASGAAINVNTGGVIRFCHSAEDFTSFTEAMRIDASGNVGIGTANGDVTNDGNASRTYVGIIGTANRGRLNIGTTASNGADAGALAFTNGANTLADISVDTTAGVQNTGTMYVNGSRAIKIQAAASDEVVFNESGADVDFRVESDNNANALFVEGGNGEVMFGKNTISSNTVGVAIRGTSGETFCSISTGNTLHVYDTVASAFRFYVHLNGGISNYSANNVNLSDEREKKNVEALPSQWDCLKHWDLKQFHYNADDDALPKKYGVIAQEIEAHCPEVIDVFKVDEDTERMGVKEQQMMWMAIKALQEAQTRIESLEARIEALES